MMHTSIQILLSLLSCLNHFFWLQISFFMYWVHWYFETADRFKNIEGVWCILALFKTSYYKNTCGSCEQPVTWSCKGVECDACFLWYHADCQKINNSMYDRLGESPSKAGVWKCLDTYETQNPYEPLDTSNHSNISFSRIQTSQIQTTTFFF